MAPLGSILIFWFLLSGLCYGNNKKVEVVGVVECSDCGKNNNVQIRRVFPGIHVTIDCKFEAGKYRTMGASKLDGRGKFKVHLPDDATTKNGKQNQNCFANLHSPFGAQCANNHNGEKSSKVIFLYKSKGKLTLGLKENLKISLVPCTSAYFWPYFKYPPLHTLPTWPIFHPPPLELPLPPPPLSESTIPSPPPVPVYESFVPPPSPSPTYSDPVSQPVPAFETPLLSPPVPIYKQPLPPTIPKFRKPSPAPSASPSPTFSNPVSQPIMPAPTFKNPLFPPPIPIYKKPLPPSIPIQKKPLPPPVPTYKKPSPRPIPPLKKLVPPPGPSFDKPLPPPTPVSSNHPSTPEKSHMTIPKAPPVPSLPQIPSAPRKYFNKPKIGNQPMSPP